MNAEHLLAECEAYLVGLGFVKDEIRDNSFSFKLNVPYWGAYYVTLRNNAWEVNNLIFSAETLLLPMYGEDAFEKDYRMVVIENVDQLKFCIRNSVMILKYEKTTLDRTGGTQLFPSVSA